MLTDNEIDEQIRLLGPGQGGYEIARWAYARAEQDCSSRPADAMGRRVDAADWAAACALLGADPARSLRVETLVQDAYARGLTRSKEIREEGPRVYAGNDVDSGDQWIGPRKPTGGWFDEVLQLEARLQRVEAALDLPGSQTPESERKALIGYVTCQLGELVHAECGGLRKGLLNRCNEVARGIVQNVRNHYERLQQEGQ